jgi:hypothetical protein
MVLLKYTKLITLQMIQSCNVLFAIRKEKYMIRSLMSILIITLSLSHCSLSSTDLLNIGAAVYGGIERDE